MPPIDFTKQADQQPQDDRDEIGLHPLAIAANPNDPNYLKVIASHIVTQPAPKIADPAAEAPAKAPMVGNADLSQAPGPLPLSGLPRQNPGVVNLMERIHAEKPQSFGGKALKTLKEIGTGALMGGEALGEAMAPTIAANIPGSMTRTNLENQHNQAVAQQDIENQINQEKAANPPEVAAIRAQEEGERELLREQAALDKQHDQQGFVAGQNTQKEHSQLDNNLAEHGMMAQYDQTGHITGVTPIPGYLEFEKALHDAQQQGKGKNAGFMTMYAAYRFYESALRENPAILPYISPMITNALTNAGVEVPKGFTEALATMPANMPENEFGQKIGLNMPGSPIAKGAINETGLFAGRFLEQEKPIRQAIQDLQQYLGPTAGRVMSGFLLGKVGTTGDPKVDRSLQALKTNLDLVATNAARYHVNSVKSIKDFESLLKTNFTPEALQGSLDAIHSWAQGAYEQGQGHNIVPQQGGAEKIVSQAQLDAYAKKNNISTADAKQFLESKGYKVQ